MGKSRKSALSPHSVAKRRPASVLHVITPSRMAGAETFLARLLRRTAETGAGAPVHCVTSRSPALGELRAAGIPLEEIGVGGKANLLALPRLFAAARRVGADLLHTHLSTASWWAGWLEEFGGPPSIGHVHGFTSAWWHRRQTHLIACSAAVRSDLIEKGIPAERITVLHYPVDPADVRTTRSRTQVRGELGAGERTPVVGTFAHLSEKKGYRELVRAAQIVLRRIPAAQFWCLGEGPLRGELEGYARKVGIADRFRLLGFRRDAANYMHAVDVMCLPSHREPFGLVYVEAALAEKPVIACHAGGAPEIIHDGKTGLLVPPPYLFRKKPPKNSVGNNVPAIADAIVSLLEDPAHAANMGRLAAENARQRFVWASYLSKLTQLYARVLGTEQGVARPARNVPRAAVLAPSAAAS